MLSVMTLTPEASDMHTAICGCMSVGKPGYGIVLTLARRMTPVRCTRMASSYSAIFTPISRSLAEMQSICLGMTFWMSTSPPVAATAAI